LNSNVTNILHRGERSRANEPPPSGRDRAELLTEARSRQLHADRVAVIAEMATALAHELSQPLTAATSYLRAAQRLMRMPKERRPASLETALDRAAEQALRAGKLLGHIREFVSRGEFDKTLWSLHDLIQDAFTLANESARQLHIDVAFEFHAGKHLVVADKIQIEQAIVNLSRNAISAMHGAASRRLTIATSCAGDNIQVDVTDTGAGFCDEAMAAFVEPFVAFRARGLDVGLSISRSIIEAHDGRIWMRPNPGGGSIVSFTLPLAEVDELS
jgi:C4-dicarboxylate-specific signal transduction histidine kinase